MLADEIRNFVFEKYIQPARERGQHTVIIRTGDVHEDMKLLRRMPAVCGAIGTKTFERTYNVQMVNREGPTQGANVFFTFEI